MDDVETAIASAAAVEIASVFAIKHDDGKWSYGVKCAAVLTWMHTDQSVAMLHHCADALRDIADGLGPRPGSMTAPPAEVVRLVPDADGDKNE